MNERDARETVTSAPAERQVPDGSVLATIGVGSAFQESLLEVELSAGVQFWLGKHFGLGGRVGLLFAEMPEPSYVYDAILLEPALMGRVGTRWITGYADIGGGVANADEKRCLESTGLVLPECERWSHDRKLVATGSTGLGVLFHPSGTGFTFGVRGRVQAVGSRPAGALVGLSVGSSF